MNLQLRDGLFHCLCGDRAIFLDTETNRYFAVPPKIEAAFRSVAIGETVQDGDRQFLDTMLADRILVESDDAEQAWPTPISPPTRDLRPIAIEKPPLWLIAKVLYARWRAGHAVQRLDIRSIRQILEGRSREKWKSAVGPLDQKLQRLQSAFEISDRLMSVRDQCLPRSLAMHALTNQFGARSSIVLGVRVNPFEAHCWVELEGAVITGDFEQAILFTPIMRMA